MGTIFHLKVVAITGGEGRHILFKHPDRHIGNKIGILPGIDIKGDGGYIVVSPSLHKSGRVYKWKPVSHLTKVSLAEIPEWLIYMVHEPKKNLDNVFKSRQVIGKMLFKGRGSGTYQPPHLRVIC